jgi:nucleotide-binding universal stress UspA family protein
MLSAMKASILASLTGLPGDRAALETALALATIEGGHIDALHVRLGLMDIAEISAVLPGHGAPLVATSSELLRNENRLAGAAKAVLDETCERHGIILAQDAPGFVQRSASWLCVESTALYETADRAGAYDIAVVAREMQLYCGRIADIVMRSGRPVVIAPAKPSSVIGRSIAIAWRPGAQASRALAAAAPFLGKAEKINLIAVPERDGDREKLLKAGEEFVGAMARTKTGVSLLVTDPSGYVADTLRGAAYKLDADLLIMGAYGHSRLEETILGGVTKAMLATCDIPVLMFH